MKILEFKSVSPLFEMERDGIEPFTIRRIDNKDKRFRALSQWDKTLSWKIRLLNPKTFEYFDRLITNVGYLWYYDHQAESRPFLGKLKFDENWRIIHFKEI